MIKKIKDKIEKIKDEIDRKKKLFDLEQMMRNHSCFWNIDIGLKIKVMVNKTLVHYSFSSLFSFILLNFFYFGA
jgi:ABC-type Na+ transport system ATPase subunit NatA